MFSIFNYAIIVYSFFILKEVRAYPSLVTLPGQANEHTQTAGKSLEEMEDVFDRGFKSLADGQTDDEIET